MEKQFIQLIIGILISFNTAFALTRHPARQEINNTVTIHGKFNDLKKGFRIYLRLTSSLNNIIDTREKYTTSDQHTFLFRLDSVNSPLYLNTLTCWNLNKIFRDSAGQITRDSTIYRKYNPESNLARSSTFKYLIEPGDSINIQESELTVRYGPLPGDYYHSLIFSGKGSDKYNFIQQLDLKDLDFRKSHNRINRYSIGNYRLIDSLAISELNILDKYRPKLSEMEFNIFQADILSHYKAYKVGIYVNSRQNNQEELDSLKTYKDTLMTLIAEKGLSKNRFVQYSSNFTQMIMENYMMDSILITGRAFVFKNCYEHFNINYSGELREKLLTLLILNDTNRYQANLLDYIDKTLENIQNAYYKKLLMQKRNELISSLYRHEFVLTDTAGKRVSISQFKDKIVLMDFWFNGCSACSNLAPDLEKLQKHFCRKDIVYLSINTDIHHERWIKGIASGIYTSNAVLNLNTIPGENNLLLKQYNIQAYPTVLLFAKDGKQVLFRNPTTDKCIDLTAKITEIENIE